MFALDYLLALAIISAPPNDPVPAPSSALLSLLQDAALTAEIMDPRERRHFFAHPGNLPSDLAVMRRRWAELRDAPAVADSLRFPDREVINGMLAFNRAYLEHLRARQAVGLHRWWEIDEVAQETERLHHLWDTVRDARCEYYYVDLRRRSLARVRDLAGREAYYSGRLPPHVPVWRFHVMD